MASERDSRIYGVLQTLIFCAYAAAVLFDRSSPVLYATGMLRRVGAALALGGVALMLVAIRTLGGSIQIAPAPKSTATLATHGVYGWFRHPIYTGIVFIAMGLVLRQPTALVGAGTVVVIAFLAVKVRFEERLLLDRYPTYAVYRTRTWGLFPFLR